MGYDSKFMAKVKKPTKELKVFKPALCLFRIQSKVGSFCSCRLNLNSEQVSGLCVCTDERWIEGCPLLKNNFVVVKN